MKTTVKPFVSALLCIISFAMGACESAEADTFTSAAAENEAVARTYMQAYNDRDLDGMRSVLADEIVVAGAAYSQDDYVALIEDYYWTSFPDMRFGEATIIGAEKHVTVHVQVLATGSGEYLGADVTDATADVGEMMLFSVEDGKIHTYQYQWDELGFLTQIGVVDDPYDQETLSPAAENEAVARAYMQAYNDRDLDAMRSVLTDEILVAGATYSQDDYIALIEDYYWTSFPDMRFGDATVVGAEDHVTVHVQVLATGSGEYLGADVTDATADVGEMMLFSVEDGKIHSYEYQWNELGFLVQMGVLPNPYE